MDGRRRALGAGRRPSERDLAGRAVRAAAEGVLCPGWEGWGGSGLGCPVSSDPDPGNGRPERRGSTLRAAAPPEHPRPPPERWPVPTVSELFVPRLFRYCFQSFIFAAVSLAVCSLQSAFFVLVCCTPATWKLEVWRHSWAELLSLINAKASGLRGNPSEVLGWL